MHIHSQTRKFTSYFGA